MKMHQTIAYAVHATLLLARQPSAQPISGRKLAEVGQLPARFLLHVLRTLVNEGILCSVRGAEGGFRLARPATQISLLQIFDAFENPMEITLADMPGLSIEMQFRIATSLREASLAARKELEKVSLDDLLSFDKRDVLPLPGHAGALAKRCV